MEAPEILPDDTLFPPCSEEAPWPYYSDAQMHEFWKDGWRHGYEAGKRANNDSIMWDGTPKKSLTRGTEKY